MNNQYASFFYLLILTALVFILWNTPALYPLKLLVVFFHESSHALATLITGGKVDEMVISAAQGGHVLSIGGNRFIILNAGYLGSLLWGAAIYYVAVASSWDKWLMSALGALIALMTLVFVGSLFTFIFGFATAAAMVFSARHLSNAINDFLLRLIGLTSMIYAPFDILSDTIQRSHLNSDASMLAREYGGFTMLWGGVWILVSLVGIFLCLRESFNSSQKEDL